MARLRHSAEHTLRLLVLLLLVVPLAQRDERLVVLGLEVEDRPVDRHPFIELTEVVADPIGLREERGDADGDDVGGPRRAVAHHRGPVGEAQRPGRCIEEGVHGYAATGMEGQGVDQRTGRSFVETPRAKRS